MSPAFEATDPRVAAQDPRFIAAIEFLRRNGAREFQMRYDEEQEPIVWVAVAGYSIINGKPSARGKINGHAAGSGMDPLSAIFGLLHNSLDRKGRCTHCGRTTMFDEGFESQVLEDVFCWYQWDPELKTFRRGCEGDE